MDDCSTYNGKDAGEAVRNFMLLLVFMLVLFVVVVMVSGPVTMLVTLCD